MKRGGLRELLTDRDNLPDTGRVAVSLAVVAMVGLAGFDVIVHGTKFDAASLGMGIGAAVGGLGPYLWGDMKRPPNPPNDGGVNVNIER